MTKKELLNLIKENPDAEILIMCGEDCWTGEYGYTGHYLNEAGIGVEKLALYKELYYDDEEELQDAVELEIWDDICDLNEEKFQQIVAKEMSKYPFEKYIVIRIG